MASSILLRHLISSASRPSHVINPWRMISTIVVSNNCYDTTITTTSLIIKSSPSTTTSNISSSPWLMLPPVFDHANDNNNNNMDLYKFYSVAEKQVLSFKTPSIKSFVGCNYDDIDIVSSSHGWLILFDNRNFFLYLYNPITGRHIDLPHTEDLDDMPDFWINKVILSSSPDKQDCIVLMSFAFLRRLAFCCPNSSNPEWIPIGDLYEKVDNLTTQKPKPRMYEDFVYSSRQKLFYCIKGITPIHHEELEAWDLHGCVPKVIPMDFSVDLPEDDLADEDFHRIAHLKYLVINEESGELFLVMRNVSGSVFWDFYNSDRNEKKPYKTIGFDVYKYDPDKCVFTYMDGGSLDGLAIFIGNSDSSAISAPTGLKPNSIYFTDVHVLNSGNGFGGHDIGIFDYEKQTVSPCYYPFGKRRKWKIEPAPMWFTPTNY